MSKDHLQTAAGSGLTFSKLPLELQQSIWKKTIPPPRIAQLYLIENNNRRVHITTSTAIFNWY
jgi:hypothetical protein